jgi:nucleoid DNA-binding protein
MDIDLFSEIVKDLILDNDEVTLPGLGTFVSEVVPSTFSDKGYTINPPYRKLSFRQRVSESDNTLVEFYSKVNGTDPAASRHILQDFIDGLRNTLQTRKVVVFPGLGRLRATKENTFFFIADEDLDIYPYGVGLEPVSLKTHEETPEEVSETVSALKEIIAGPAVSQEAKEEAKEVKEEVKEEEAPVEVQEDIQEQDSRDIQETPGEDIQAPAAAEEAVPVDEAASVEDDAPAEEAEKPEEEVPVKEEIPAVKVPAAPPAPKKARHRRWKTALVALLCAAAVVLLALGIFLLLSRVAPDFIDSLLYTPEELRIINY